MTDPIARDRVALVPTCVIEGLAPDVGAAVVRVLRSNGWEPAIPDGVTCCGQPAWNAGFAQEAAAVAATTLDALHADDAATVCVPAGSCAAMMRVYWPQLFRIVGDTAREAAAVEVGRRVKEFTELVATRVDDTRSAAGAGPVAYHHSCHMLRELHIEDAPLELLDSAGIETTPWTSDQRCCGFGGLFSLKQPEISVAMADDKLAALDETNATQLVGSDLSCLLHLEGRMVDQNISLPVSHIAELLDEA